MSSRAKNTEMFNVTKVRPRAREHSARPASICQPRYVHMTFQGCFEPFPLSYGSSASPCQQPTHHRSAKKKEKRGGIIKDAHMPVCIYIHIYDHAHRIENGAPCSLLMQLIPHDVHTETQRQLFFLLFSMKGAAKLTVGKRTIKRENGNRNSYHDSVTRRPTLRCEGRSFVSLH